MNWEKLIAIKCWTPLQDVFNEPEHFGQGLYRVGDNAFVLTKPYDQTLIDGPLGTKNITLLFWIENIKNIDRLVFQKTGPEYVLPKVTPPAELLRGGDGTYSSMQSIGKNFSGSFLESATYSPPDWLFVHKCLKIDRFKYCFLSKNIIDNEKTYGIAIRLL